MPGARDFNPRTREGCDPSTGLQCGSGVDFNPRTREGCDVVYVGLMPACLLFQSTHPRGVRHKARKVGICNVGISIHAPARGATQKVLSHYKSPRISIHAPARGATHRRGGQGVCRQISIHAPARGATNKKRFKICVDKNISIHAPARGATYFHQYKQKETSISIHAPARGATKRL